jgi:hypothetical protein
MVRIERDSAVLSYWALSLLANDWKPIEQRMPITWTNCPFWPLCLVCLSRPRQWPLPQAAQLNAANKDENSARRQR